MKGAIAIFVKTVGLSPIKTRLAKTIGKKRAEDFFLQCVGALEKTVLQVKNHPECSITPYWAVAEKQAIDHDLWANLEVIHTGEGGLGQRLHNIYSALRKKYDYVILLGADTPHISADLLIEASDLLQNKPIVIGKTHDGGFYLFGGAVDIDKSTWLNVEYSCDVTCNQLIENLHPQEISFLKTLTDVDEEEDLTTLKDEMSSAGIIKL